MYYAAILSFIAAGWFQSAKGKYSRISEATVFCDARLWSPVRSQIKPY
jgi:hypothetical protein